MRTLGIAILIAWLSVGLDLLWLPSGRLDFELAVSKDFLEGMKDSPLRELPDFQQASDNARRLIADPSRREIGIWVMWSALLLLVGFGFWTAHAVFHRRPNARMLVFFGSFLFVGRQAVFHRAVYDHLFDDHNPVLWSLKTGNYNFAFSIVWYHYVLAIFFLLLALFTSIQLVHRSVEDLRPFKHNI